MDEVNVLEVVALAIAYPATLVFIYNMLDLFLQNFRIKGRK